VPIARASITKAEYADTIEFSDEGKDNWKALMRRDLEGFKKRRK